MSTLLRYKWHTGRYLVSMHRSNMLHETQDVLEAMSAAGDSAWNILRIKLHFIFVLR